MDWLNIVQTVLTLAANGHTPAQIAAALPILCDGAKHGIPPADMTRVLLPEHKPASGNRGSIPAVAYALTSAYNTATKLATANLPGREAEIAFHILANGQKTRRQLSTELGHATKKIAESACHQLRVRGVLASVSLTAPDPKPAPKARGIKLGGKR